MSKHKPQNQPSGSIDDASLRKIRRLESEVLQLRSAVDELNLLNELALTASSTTDVDIMLNAIVLKAMQAVKAEEGTIKLVTEEIENPLQTLVRQQDPDHFISSRIGIHITGWVLQQRKPLLIEDLAGDDRFDAKEGEVESIRSLLCVPVQFRGKLLGILMVRNKKSASSFNTADARLLSIIASQAGQLIRNRQLQQEAREKERIRQELELARGIQLNLLPEQLLEDEQFDVFTHIDTAEQVGGDYYDAFSIGDQLPAIVIADVSGHGPAAALIMTMLKGMLHSLTRHHHSAAAILTELNRMMAHMAPPEIFVTMCMLVFDVEKGEVHYANAGHPPLLRIKSADKASELQRFDSAALNLTLRSTYEERMMPFLPGDMLLLYTDGLTEVMNAEGEMFGGQRLLEVARSQNECSSGEFVEGVLQSVKAYAGNQAFTDDMAIIAIKKK